MSDGSESDVSVITPPPPASQSQSLDEAPQRGGLADVADDEQNDRQDHDESERGEVKHNDQLTSGKRLENRSAEAGPSSATIPNTLTPGPEDGSQRPQPQVIECKHLEASDMALRRYAAGMRWGRRVCRGEVARHDGDNDDDEQYDNKRRRLLPHPCCADCHIALNRPFICLECAYPACFLAHVGQGSDCMRAHLRDAQHAVAFDIFDGTLYCLTCDDIVYDSRFAEVAAEEQSRAAADKGGGGGLLAKTIGAIENEPGADGDDPLIICKQPRGLYNLGATCFMNVILQSFVHNSLIRNYFLSDRHNSSLCPARENCLACELDNLFIEFFSTQTRTAPFAPTNFLFCVYLARESTELSSGAGEHDAHELFIAALNGVHSALMAVGREHSSRSDRLPVFPHGDQAHGLVASRSGTASNASDDGEEETLVPAFRYTSEILCPCVVHRTFAGVLQSDVTCQRCGWTSTTHDPFLDLSLDIRSGKGRSTSFPDFDGDLKKKGKKQKDDRKLARESSALDDEQNLLECLRHYCAIEKLAQSDYSCAQCGVPSQAVKQLSICRLPPVLCIQLKRFEHNTTAGAKIESRIKFPLSLDLYEFHTVSMREDIEIRPEPESFIYDLFSVVVHEGRLNTGHYYCYYKWREEWFIANDDAVRPAKLDDVLSCRAYQLCYRRRALQNIRAET